MTNLPRFTISLPHDIAEKVNAMKNTPEFEKTPKSKIIAFLIRQGMERGTESADGGGTENAKSPDAQSERRKAR